MFKRLIFNSVFEFLEKKKHFPNQSSSLPKGSCEYELLSTVRSIYADFYQSHSFDKVRHEEFP